MSASARLRLPEAAGYDVKPVKPGWLLSYSALIHYEIEAAVLRLANAIKG